MRFARAALLLLCFVSPVAADGRTDWNGYDWRGQPYGKCLEVDGQACLTHHGKWDWKRNQWVDVTYAPDIRGIDLALRLTNNDRKDDDWVCVTVLFLDAAGANLAAYHANLHIDPLSVVDDGARLSLPEAVQQRLARVDVGTKQCRKGRGQDDGVYAAVKARLPR
ncbi:hypothetical protein [Devosia chinhatensis]|uniref:hypothetical protein n=1 Tax=Devosia chinhatensis TaxID=429727 RepID=UPI000A4D6383|nr:hypothetical protein [Devosia chinhatensis]